MGKLESDADIFECRATASDSDRDNRLIVERSRWAPNGLFVALMDDRGLTLAGIHLTSDQADELASKLWAQRLEEKGP